MRAVIDTNVLIAALLWHGPPHALLACVRGGQLGLISSPKLLSELANVLARAKFDAIFARSNTSRENALTEVRRLAEVIDPPALTQAVCRDPDDDELLALAVASQADLIASGDNDPLVLLQFDGIPILDPVRALARLGIIAKG